MLLKKMLLNAIELLKNAITKSNFEGEHCFKESFSCHYWPVSMAEYNNAHWEALCKYTDFHFN